MGKYEALKTGYFLKYSMQMMFDTCPGVLDIYSEELP